MLIREAEARGSEAGDPADVICYGTHACMRASCFRTFVHSNEKLSSLRRHFDMELSMPLQPPVMAPYSRINWLGVLIVTDLYVPHPRPETASGHLWWQKLRTLLHDFGWLGVKVRQRDLFDGRNLLATNAGKPIGPSTIGAVVAEFPFPWPGTMPKEDEWNFRDTREA